MTRVEEIRELYAFNRWATERMLDAAATLPEEGFTKDMGNSFSSIRDTLVHIMSAEWVWLSRWHGTSPSAMPQEWKTFSLSEVRSHWAELDRSLQQFVASVTEADLDRAISYRNTAGEAYTTPLYQMLRHVVNHSSYHRGQVTTMLRQQGSAPPSTDLILYYRTIAPALPAS